MTKKNSPYARSITVLDIISKTGPITTRGLQSLIEPPIQAKHLRAVLNRLKRKLMVTRRYDSVFGKSAIFHELARNNVTRAMLGTRSFPNIGHRQLLHTERCSIVAEQLRRQFPEFEIIKEYDLPKHPEARKTLFEISSNTDQRPDILIISRKLNDENEPCSIGIEIERTQKSTQRLVHKLARYAEETRLDGVVYICSTEHIKERLRTVFNSSVIEEALRVKHYGKNFLLICAQDTGNYALPSQMFNAQLENINLTAWMHALNSTIRRSRRNHLFTK